MQKKRWFFMKVRNILNKNRTMKLSFLLFAFVLFNLHANSYGQKNKISLDIEDKSIKHVLDEIEEKSEFNFFYKTEQIDVQRKVSIKIIETSVDDILKLLFQGEGISFKLIKKQIVLKRVKINVIPKKEKILDVHNNLAQYNISGTVLDENGSPLPGANIIEKGTANGTQSDFDGNFTLEVLDENAILEISYIGFSKQEISLSGQTTLNVQLQPDA
ncbi:unnamed protein product, partial [Ectocarpus sp. 12 AP-2014]